MIKKARIALFYMALCAVALTGAARFSWAQAGAGCGFNSAGDYTCEGSGKKLPGNPGSPTIPGYGGKNAQDIQNPGKPPYTPGDLNPGLTLPYVPFVPVIPLPISLPIPPVPVIPVITCNLPDTVTIPGQGSFTAQGKCKNQKAYNCTTTGGVSDQTLADTQQLIAAREGNKNCAYQDTNGYWTIGIGHLIKSGDGYGPGTCLSDSQVSALFQKDSQKYYEAAKKQAAEYGVNDSCFVTFLTSLNYQWGTAWQTHDNGNVARDKLRQMDQQMKAGDWCGALATHMSNQGFWKYCIRALDLATALAKQAGSSCSAASSLQ
jgi:GH24 family phage-related lysozyme (muramidase)